MAPLPRLSKTLPPSENSMRALPSRPLATLVNYSVRKPPISAYPLSPFRRTARPRPTRAGDRHPNNRESRAVFRCRNCGLYAHAGRTAAVIIRSRAYVRHCEWQSGHTSDVLTAPTGWREQSSGSEPPQPRLGLELSVLKPEGTATSSHRSRVRGPRPDRRIQIGGPRRQN